MDAEKESVALAQDIAKNVPEALAKKGKAAIDRVAREVLKYTSTMDGWYRAEKPHQRQIVRKILTQLCDEGLGNLSTREWVIFIKTAFQARTNAKYIALWTPGL